MKINLSKKELILIANMLELASDKFSNHGCNDIDESTYSQWTKEEKEKFAKGFFNWNDPDWDDDDDIKMIGDYSVMHYLSDKILNCVKLDIDE